MRTSIKLAGAALVAALVFAGTVTAASARNLSISNQNFRVVYTPLIFEIGSGTPINCNVTMEGSFHYRTSSKSIGSLTGYITRAVVSHPCTGFGEAWIYNGIDRALTNNVNSLPWHTTFEGFTGTLPAIASLRLLAIGSRFVIQGVFGVCLSVYGPNSNNAIATLNASGVITEIHPESQAIPQESGTCGTGVFSGRGVVTVLGSTTSITIRLI
jgi:hypothetical protein